MSVEGEGVAVKVYVLVSQQLSPWKGNDTEYDEEDDGFTDDDEEDCHDENYEGEDEYMEDDSGFVHENIQNGDEMDSLSADQEHRNSFDHLRVTPETNSLLRRSRVALK